MAKLIRAEEQLMTYILSGTPLVWVKTSEEHRALLEMVNRIVTTQVVNKAGHKEKYRAYTWDVADGLRNVSVQKGVFMSGSSIGIDPEDQKNPFCGDPLAPLDWLEKTENTAENMGLSTPTSGTVSMENTIVFLKDYHNFLNDKCQSAPLYKRKIKNLLQEFKACSKTIVILSPIIDIPVELDKDVVVIDCKLPGRDELLMILKGVCEGAGIAVPKGVELKEILDAALGLTLNEAENAFSVSSVKSKTCFDPEVIRKEKAAIVKKSGMLEVVETDQTLADIGGLEVLKEFVSDSATNFSEEALEYGINPIKGMLFLGVSGCGKSLTAKTVANEWKRTLLRLDMGKVYGKFVGESENNMIRCLDIASAVAPVCLWIDEAEKGLSGSKAGSTNTHETTQRVMQTLLTWMQDKKEDVVLIFTANSVQSLPPELLRSGRIDAIFWVDLPDAVQRTEILKIHLRKVKRNPNLFNEEELKQIIAVCEGYTGAEIECWVQEALKHGFKKNHKPDPTVSDFLETVNNVTPIVRLMKDDIDASRKWAKERGARNASIVHDNEIKNTATPVRQRKVHNDFPQGPVAAS